MTREEKIRQLVRLMLGPATLGRSGPLSPLRAGGHPSPAFVAAIIDALPPERFAGKDRAWVKLDYLLRNLGGDSRDSTSPRPSGPRS
jgi:hypothetical protein